MGTPWRGAAIMAAPQGMADRPRVREDRLAQGLV
jgi:hypothetical protein